MDVSKFNTFAASDTPQTLRLVNPFDGTLIVDENGRTLDIQVLGAQSAASRNAAASRKRKGGNKNLTEEQLERAGAEYLASITVGWSDNFEMGGEALPFSRENAIKLYLSEDWIAKQSLEFSSNLGNYDPKISSD